MKKVFLIVLVAVIMLISVISLLNVSVTTKQGIDYRVHEIKLPLYLKILDFVDRHYNYKNLVAYILGDTKNDDARTMKIFDWVTANVRENPEELPVIDDHPFNILIRGYGVQDQFEDIFTILCTYAGMEAFFKVFKNQSGESYYISFVKIGGKWCPLSAFRGVYAAKDGVIASVDDILLDRKLLTPFESKLLDFEMDTFLKEINGMTYKADSTRTNGQSPAGRALCFIKNIFHRNRK
jgi:hypothetical protein